MNFRYTLLVFALTAVLPVVAHADGDACGIPQTPCTHTLKKFAPYELSFQLPKVIKPNTDYKSTPFYAVVLWTRPISEVDECDAGEWSRKLEAQRRTTQTLFPTRKVFADQQCPDMGAVSYQLNGKPNSSRFLAIYGGKNQAEANGVLAKIKKRYPKASVRRVQVVWQQIMQ